MKKLRIKHENSWLDTAQYFDKLASGQRHRAFQSKTIKHTHNIQIQIYS